VRERESVHFEDVVVAIEEINFIWTVDQHHVPYTVSLPRHSVRFLVQQLDVVDVHRHRLTTRKILLLPFAHDLYFLLQLKGFGLFREVDDSRDAFHEGGVRSAPPGGPETTGKSKGGEFDKFSKIRTKYVQLHSFLTCNPQKIICILKNELHKEVFIS
jgi:hypothetical protein